MQLRTLLCPAAGLKSAAVAPIKISRNGNHAAAATLAAAVAVGDVGVHQHQATKDMWQLWQSA